MILRKLEEGWDFRPDWRAAVVDEKLREKPTATLGQLCADEEDLVIRHALRFKKTGTGVAKEVFDYAFRCDANRTKNIAAAIIRSMTIAGFSVEEIAKRLSTAPLNVVVYQRLCWDVRPYRENRQWLGSIIVPSTPVNVRDPIAIKEQLLLAAAFHRGRTGLQQLLDGTVPTSAGEIEELAIAIRGALTLRANQFALQTMQTALGPDDLVRFVEFMRLPPMQSSQAQRTKLDAFRQGMMQILWEKETEANAAKRDQCLKVVAEQIASPAANFSTS